MTQIEIYDQEKLDNRRQKLETIYNILVYYDQELNAYTEYLFTSGLSRKDIKPLKKIMNFLQKLEYTIKNYISKDIQERYFYKLDYSYRYSEEDEYLYQTWDSLIRYENHLLTSLGSIMIPFYKMLKELESHYKKRGFYQFIEDESSLLHLVSTNNHKFANIPRVSDDAYLFCCQFHTDHTPSMRVNSHNNRLKCYGCGIELDIIDYIMQVEGLDRYHAHALLAAIFKIEFKNNPYNEESELVKKYTNSYVLSKYKKRLETGKKRAKYKNKNFNNYLAMENYDRELSLLDRIKKNEYISYENKKDNKRLIYEMPDFSEN